MRSEIYSSARATGGSTGAARAADDRTVRQEDGRPFARELLPRRAGPFVLAVLLAFALLPLGRADTDPGWAAAAAAAAAGIGLAAWIVPWQRLPRWAEAGPPLAFFAVIAFLRQSQDGELTGLGPLLVLPVLWLLLYGTRRQVGAAVLGVVATMGIPIVTGQVSPPGPELRLLVLWTAVAVVVSFTALRLADEIRRQAAELERLASTDALTGLANRRVWEDALPRELARSVRSGAPVSIAILDLDRFKQYNDANGHQGGDLLLKEIAASWPAELRDSDLLARYGGEEFALLLPDCGAADVERVVEKVRAATPAGVTSSAGAAVWDGVEEPEELVRRADEALYEAKRAGRDRTVVAGPWRRPERAGA
jgi:diguanylate cyclase (GGDEF)-like protein